MLAAQLRACWTIREPSLVSNFAGQWLYTRSLSQQKPDPDAFPNSTRASVPASSAKPSCLPGHLREDRPLIELLDANYTFLNQRLGGTLWILLISTDRSSCKVTLADPNLWRSAGAGKPTTVAIPTALRSYSAASGSGESAGLAAASCRRFPTW